MLVITILYVLKVVSDWGSIMRDSAEPRNQNHELHYVSLQDYKLVLPPCHTYV